MSTRRRRLIWLDPAGDPTAFPNLESAQEDPPGLIAADRAAVCGANK